MKYKAYQVAPEYQTAPDIMDIVDDTIAITGNRYLRDFTPDAFLQAQAALEYGENPAEEGAPDYDKWESLIDDYSQQAHPDEETICAALELLTGEKWAHKVLCGDSQGDWQNCYYVASVWAREALDATETEYFNTGTEWRVVDEDGDEGYTYCHGWRDEDNRAEIADTMGVGAADVTLYKFAGWARTPKYEEA